MTTHKPYYILLVRDAQPDENGNLCIGPWGIHFGDYDRACVVQERDDITEHDYQRRHTKIIDTFDDQSRIDAVIAAVNEV